MEDLLTDLDRPCSTLEAAKLLGMAVRSVQLMVDRARYRFALDRVTVVHKSRLVVEVPARLRDALTMPPQEAAIADR